LIYTADKRDQALDRELQKFVDARDCSENVFVFREMDVDRMAKKPCRGKATLIVIDGGKAAQGN
jgi:hypothetical protein